MISAPDYNELCPALQAAFGQRDKLVINTSGSISGRMQLQAKHVFRIAAEVASTTVAHEYDDDGSVTQSTRDELCEVYVKVQEPIFQGLRVGYLIANALVRAECENG